MLLFGSSILHIYVENNFFHIEILHIPVKKKITTVVLIRFSRIKTYFNRHMLHSLFNWHFWVHFLILSLVSVPSFLFGSVGVFGRQYVLFLDHPLSTLVFTFSTFTAKMPAEKQVYFVYLRKVLNTVILKVAGSCHRTDILHLWYWLQKELQSK